MRVTISTADTDAPRLGIAEGTEAALAGLRVLLATQKGSVPFYREFGLTMAYLDRPLPVAQALIAAELAEAVARFVPEARLRGVTVRPDGADGADGKLTVEVEVEL